MRSSISYGKRFRESRKLPRKTRNNTADKLQLVYADYCKNTRIINSNEVKNAKTYIITNDFKEILQQGFAIKIRESNRFTEKQKEYLKKLFNDGENDISKRARADAVERDMIREFSPDLVLEESQIQSYFSKLSSEKKRKIQI